MAVVPPRWMSCSNCEHRWDTPAVQPQGAFRCPNCGVRVCACGCGESLVALRADSRYISRAHEMSLRRRDWGSSEAASAHAASTGVGSRGGNVRSIEQARDLQETFKQDWSRRVKLHIARTLLATGHFHADDLAALEIPTDHTNIRGAQIGSFASTGLMEPTGVERPMAHAAANSRKGKIFRITEKGRRELPRMLAGAGATEEKQGEGSAGTHDSGPFATAPAPSTGGTIHRAPTSVGPDPGESSAGGQGFAGLTSSSPSDAAPGGASPDHLFDPGEDRSSTSPYSAEAA
jgi:hypothetical protein